MRNFFIGLFYVRNFASSTEKRSDVAAFYPCSTQEKMEKYNLTSKVCEQLAQQLVEEQAELVKRTAVVEQIKNSIREKKMDVIGRKLMGRVFKYRGKRYIVTNLEHEYEGNGLFVLVHLGEYKDPINEAKLTKRERALLLEYREALKTCRWTLVSEESRKAHHAAKQLRILKHGIDLEVCFSEFFNFDEFAQPDFFKHSGIMVQTDRLRPDTFLEDC